MARKRTPLTREQLLARMPHRIFSPKLARSTITMVALCHVENLDAIWSGQANLTLMWEWAEGVLTWSHVACNLGRLQEEMNEQLEVVARTVERFHRTGRVGFSGPDYQIAKAGVSVMDALAAEVDQTTATAAAVWSHIEVDRLIQLAREASAALQPDTELQPEAT